MSVRSRPLRPRPLLRGPTEPLAPRDNIHADEVISPYRPRAATIEGISSMLTTQRPAKRQSFLAVEEPEVEVTSPLLAPDDINEIREFLKRKDWIEQKIRLYETMPDIDVFAGVDELALHPGQPITGASLPTREEYEFWLEEQQGIEREMEYFDKGDLNRLKKFAKTKSRESNLSADDTDLVELTLTTLLALEKLNAHLRRRSDRIEALRLRLLWEDQRMEAWKDRQELLGDLEGFVKRSRWSPSTYNVYDDPTPEPDTAAIIPPTTLGSSSSGPGTDIAPPSYERSRTVSATSTNVPAGSVVIPQSLLPSPHADFSRTHRFTLADGLSREAAGYASRVMSFKSSRITPSANTLEKLIAVSREKVPDEILNEQDRLEVKSSVLDGLGRFGMNIAMQWVKADQSFGDLKRVQAMGETLTREILAAKVQHPTERQNALFQERRKLLSDKVKSLVDPSTSRSFPRPLHPAYPDQHASNQYILSVLGVEVSKARTMSSEASAAAEEYQTLFKAVVHIDKQVEEMARLTIRLSNATEKITKGSGLTKEGDGTPIDISTEACLDPAKHMLYLTTLPNLTWELDDADEAADRTISTSRGTLADLEEAGVEVDHKLKVSVEKAILGLETERMKSEKVLDEVSAKSGFLREARELHTTVQDMSRGVSLMRQELAEVAEQGRWKLLDDEDDLDVQKDGASVVTEEDGEEDWTIIEHPSSGSGSSKSTSSPSASTSTSASATADKEVDPSKDFHRRIDEISSHISSHISPRQSQLLPALAPRLATHIARGYDILINDIAVLREAIRTWEEIRRQAKVMADVRRDARSLIERAEEMKCKLISTRRSVSRQDSPNADGGVLITKHNLISSQFIQLQEEINEFVQSLPSRIPLLTSTASTRGPRLNPHANPNPIKTAAARIFSFSLADLDDDVKTDANAIAAKMDESASSISAQLAQLRIIGYVFYCSSFVVPSRIAPALGFNKLALKMSNGIISSEWYLAALIGNIRGFKEGIFGDGGKSQLEQFQHLARLQFAQLSQDVATIRREYEQEREERLRSQREFKREMEGIVEQLRAQTMTPGRVSTARLEEIASSLANLTAFVNDSESTREEDRALERMRQIALSMQRTVTFAPRNPFESPST
ncbi:hypothetical protein FRC05_011683 [Tulasnella sp. 425]|nr:hypothetical protein FRC05_011683 [Tulasnella sp. 425]